MTTAPLFLVPMRTEALAVRFGSRQAEILRVGMGPARATTAARDVALRSDETRPIVLVGLCGGLVPELRSGDVVVASSISLLSSGDSVALQGADEVAQVLSTSKRQVRVAPIVSSPKILHGDDNRLLASASGAVGVDMESYWCASLLRSHPFVVVRVVFDEFGAKFLSPRTVGAAVHSLRSLWHAARTLATSFPTIPSNNSLQEAGES